MTTKGDQEYFARRLEVERRMANQALDAESRQRHVQLASEYARRTRMSAGKGKCKVLIS